MNYALTLVIAPETEPLTAAELVPYLRIETPEEDSEEEKYLNALIKTAREYCEEYQRRAYITQTWKLSLSAWPHGCIGLPKGSLQSVTSIVYKDSAGAEHTLTAGTDYIVSTTGIVGRVSPPYGGSWPTASLYPLDPISITYKCGYGDSAADIPERAKQAMRLLISHWYDQRAPVLIGSVSNEIEFTVHALLAMDRIAVV